MKLKNYRMKHTGTTEDYCDNCGKYTLVTNHHLIFGSGRRKFSDYFGLVRPLCMDCHHEIHHGTEGSDLANHYRVVGQQQFEAENPDLDFKEVFGRYYD